MATAEGGFLDRPVQAQRFKAPSYRASVRDRGQVLLANSIYHLTNDGAVSALAGQIIVLQAVFGGFGPAEVGLLGGTTLVVTAVFQILFGIMSDRRDPSRFLPIGIVILGIGSLAASLSWNFWSLLFLVALSRVAARFYHPVGIFGIGRVFARPAVVRAMGSVGAFWVGGDTLGRGGHPTVWGV